jgi:hypothetical protein
MNHQPGAPGPMTFGGPFSPALAHFRTQLSRETAKCWLLIALAAICTAPLSQAIFSVFFMFFPDLLGGLSSDLVPAQLSGPVSFLAVISSLVGTVVGMAGALLLPVLVVVWAVALNRRTYKLTVRDLVWGGMALCLIEESFSHVVEEAKRERYRPNPSPVKPGASFGDHLNHYAYYYRQYYRLSFGPGDLRVPMVVQGNCWVEGSALALSGCLTCLCIGVILMIPLALRAVLVWPRIIAIKQAAIDFLAGKFDADLERIAGSAGRPA